MENSPASIIFLGHIHVEPQEGVVGPTFVDRGSPGTNVNGVNSFPPSVPRTSDVSEGFLEIWALRLIKHKGLPIIHMFDRLCSATAFRCGLLNERLL